MLGSKNLGRVVSMGMKLHGAIRGMGYKTPLKSGLSAISNILPSAKPITNNHSNQSINQYIPTGLSQKNSKVNKSYIEKQ